MTEIILSEKPLIRLIHGDCMAFMSGLGENAYDLAVVDPPYGINKDGQVKTTGGHGGRKAHAFKGWDKSTPDAEYFSQLMWISKNQIIWGANYFSKYLPSSMGWVFWDKGQRINQSDGELAFTSFERALRVVEYNRVELLKEGTMHPTQKPIVLYKWLLKKYAKPGDSILDTHGGSMSSVIAAYDMGFDITCIELDKDYFDAAVKRIKRFMSEPKIDFGATNTGGEQTTLI